MQTYLNFALIISAVGLSVYYLVRGRKADRQMIVVNFIASGLVAVGYILVYIDAFYYDFATMREVSMIFLNPINTILICVQIANILRIGKNHES